jgi:ligand-binding sensor domain-containing protein
MCGFLAAGALGAAQLPLRRYTTADGLPNDEINHIVSDSRGFLWFATDEGLSRFDGYSFSNLTTVNGLPHRMVTRVLVDHRGAYWIGTANGLARFRPELPISSPDRMVVFRPNGHRGSEWVNYLLEDHNGRIWCATRAGLYSIDPGPRLRD